jgi:hypothetical protein
MHRTMPHQCSVGRLRNGNGYSTRRCNVLEHGAFKGVGALEVTCVCVCFDMGAGRGNVLILFQPRIRSSPARPWRQFTHLSCLRSAILCDLAFVDATLLLHPSSSPPSFRFRASVKKRILLCQPSLSEDASASPDSRGKRVREVSRWQHYELYIPYMCCHIESNARAHTHTHTLISHSILFSTGVLLSDPHPQ